MCFLVADITRGPVQMQRRKRVLAKKTNSEEEDDDLPIKRRFRIPTTGPINAIYNTWQIFTTNISLYLLVYLAFRFDLQPK
jgi:hypothetical protein